MASGPDPLPKQSKELRFKEAVQKPPTKRQNVTSYWRERGMAQIKGITRGGIVRKKIASLRTTSSPQHPICFRCTEKGHLANECRNAQLCFICNKLGHRAPQCRSVTINPPSPVNGKAIPLPPIKLIPQANTLQQSTPPPTAGKSMKALIRTLYETEASEGQDQQFRCSFFLDDAPVPELDPGTFFKSERHFAQIKLGVCDLMLLPPMHWVLHHDPGGYLFRFDLIIKIEHERNLGPRSWVCKTATTDPNKAKSSKAKGVTIVDTASKATKRTPPPNAPAGKDSQFGSVLLGDTFPRPGVDSETSPDTGSLPDTTLPEFFVPVLDVVSSNHTDINVVAHDSPAIMPPPPPIPVPAPGVTEYPVSEEEWATWLAADGTTLMEVQCGMVNGVTIEHRPHR
ncbi:Gag polyprotein [Carex littledalei]|uniref:Gag polyprotein n=1 Tax=Carex littledalei TaxID=544730 RepID=A0A833QMJ5_9POAL|nr:Gag polyprotein [Carex littledalei]